MRTYGQYVTVAVALVLIVVVAIVQGSWSERWGKHVDLLRFTAQLDRVPTRVNEWRGKKLEKPSERIQQAAGAVGMLSIAFNNQRSLDQQVQLHLVCGRLGDVFYHTPDRCYPAAGFSSGGDPVRQVIDVPGGKAEFYTTTFTKQEPSRTEEIRIYWSWSADGSWIAPDSEKWTFAGRRALYKVYIVTNAVAGETGSKNAGVDFVRAYWPKLTEALKPAFDTENEMIPSGKSKTTAAETARSAAKT